ncbi:MAG: nucleotide-binding protein [Methermicoccaceae archaeon]
MRQIAIYGKGGIGKSLTCSNISAALASKGRRVMQVGCDPKHDSTRLLLGRTCRRTVLELMRKAGAEAIQREDVVHEGFGGVLCVEAGGPEPGVGCAGRGIIATFQVLERLGMYERGLDYCFYDVLGDVVCGGFAMPIREGYAREIYIITSGEPMSIYAANNICKGIKRFEKTSSARLAGIIANLRGMEGESTLVSTFASAINTKVVGTIPRDATVQRAERAKKTVVEFAPECALAQRYVQLAETIENNTLKVSPEPLDFDALEELLEAQL